MKHRIAEINIDTKDGGFVSGLLKVKSQKDLHKKLNKMLGHGKVTLGCLSVKSGDIMNMELRMMEVH